MTYLLYDEDLLRVLAPEVPRTTPVAGLGCFIAEAG